MSKYIFVFIFLGFISCKKTERDYTYDNIDFKQEMRNFVKHISHYAKNQKPGFNIITQNGVELITVNGRPDGITHYDYVDALDAQSQEGLFYGYEVDDMPTTPDKIRYLKQFLNKAKAQDKTIMITDYCSSPDNIRKSRDSVEHNQYIGFTATHRELDIIPQLPVPNENHQDIDNLNQAKNYLYLINYQNFSNKMRLLESIAVTNYDVVIMDLFYQGQAFTTQDLERLSHKANGGKRLLIAYVSIGEAEDYRYYWQASWNNDHPVWLDEENPDWQGNYKVRYWEKDWQDIIYGNNQSYLKKVIDAGFDGAFLDVIDAYEFFEQKTGNNDTSVSN